MSYGRTAAALPVFAGFTCGALLACTFIFLPSEVSGQVATCFDTELTSQAEVDSFDPNCTNMVGDLVINDRSSSSTGAIRDLTPLRNLEQVENLVIHNNNDLSSLNGLNIQRVTNCLSIANNPRLGSANGGLVGLSNLESVGTAETNLITHFLCESKGLTIDNNPNLRNLTSFLNLTSVGGYLRIEANGLMASILGLRNVTGSVETLKIINNDTLTNLTGLEGITEISRLTVERNLRLENVDALRFSLFPKYQPGTNRISVTQNAALGACEGLARPLQWPRTSSIPSSLIDPSNVAISGNATGCQSAGEIYASVLGPTRPVVLTHTYGNGRSDITFTPGNTQDALYPVQGHSFVCEAGYFSYGEQYRLTIPPGEERVHTITNNEGIRAHGGTPTSFSYTFALPEVDFSADGSDVSVWLTRPYESEVLLHDRATGRSYPPDPESPEARLERFNQAFVWRNTADGDYRFRVVDHRNDPTAPSFVTTLMVGVGAVAGAGTDMSIAKAVANDWPVFDGDRVSVDSLQNDLLHYCELYVETRPKLKGRGANNLDPFTPRLISAPDPPTLQSPSGDTESLVFTATARSVIGEEVDEYEVRCSNAQGTVTERSQSLYDDIELTGLEPGEEYQCSARAHNRLGWGGWSSAIAVSTDNVGGLPIWLLYEATQG